MQHFLSQSRQIRCEGLRPPEFQRTMRGSQQEACLIRHAGLQVGAAHIDADKQAAHFCLRLPMSARISTRWASSWAALKP